MESSFNQIKWWQLWEHHLKKMYTDATPERSARIHDLTKRLNKETPEIEQ